MGMVVSGIFSIPMIIIPLSSPSAPSLLIRAHPWLNWFSGFDAFKPAIFSYCPEARIGYAVALDWKTNER
jgi:hypothetical protein